MARAGKMPALRKQREFDAFAHGVDAVSANANTITEMPFEGTRFCTAPSARAFRGLSAFCATESNDGVVALAVHAARVGGLLERADGQQSLDKNFKKLDETTELLYRNN